MMKRIVIILCAVLVISALILSGCSKTETTTTTTGTTSTQAIELKFSYWPPPADPWVIGGILPFGPAFEKATNNKVKVTFFCGATLGAPPDHLDLVKNDIADIGWINPAFTSGVFPLCDIRNLPFLYPSVEVAAKVFWKQQEYINPIEFKDIKALWTFPTPLMELSTVTKQVKTLDDLKGLKFGETEPINAKSCAALGLSPVVIPDETQIYTSLQTKMLDGRFQEWNGLQTWKCGEVTNWRVTNVRIATHQNVIIMNLQKYNSLPEDVRQALDDVTGFNLSAQEGVVWAQIEKDAQARQLAADQARGVPAPYVLPDSERQKMITATQSVVDDWIKTCTTAGKGAQAQELLNLTKQWIADYSK
jgi:TRAP-type C4-dicarboxylate transport system substrate-binding protein